MKAVALIGGEGTRLRPLTYSRPKALVPIAGRPFLAHFIDHLRAHGIGELILAGARGAREIAQTFGDGDDIGVRLAYVDEPVPLGSGGAILNCAALLGDSTFLVANGDVLTGIDLTAMLDHHRRTGAFVSIALTHVDDTAGFGVVELDPSDRILRFVEKPPTHEAPSHWANAGLWLFEPGALRRIAPGHSMVETALFPELIAAGERVFGYRSSAYWLDIGTMARYLQAQGDRMALTDGVRGEGAHIDAGAHIEPPVVAGRGAVVRAGARVLGPATLGEGCDIAAGAEVVASVLWDRVQVEHGALVRRSALADDVVIGAGAIVEDAALGQGATVAPGARPPRGLRLDPGEMFPHGGG